MDGILLKSNGKTLKAYRIQVEPVLVMEATPRNHLVPGMDAILSASEARAVIEDLKFHGTGKVVHSTK